MSTAALNKMNQLLDPNGTHVVPHLFALLFGITRATVEDLTRSAITIIVFSALALDSIFQKPHDPVLLSMAMLLLGYYIGRVDKLASGWMKERDEAEKKKGGKRE